MKPSKIYYAMLVAACAACFGAGYSLKKMTTVYVDVPKTVTDTLYVQVDRVVYKQLPARHDTAWVDLEHVVHDTVGTDHFAALDTMLSAGGRDYGRLNLWYYPHPDVFSLSFDPAPLPEITVTKYIEVGRHWYNNPYFTLGAGVLAGVAVTQMSK